MTNKLEEIQEENRKFIIIANNLTAKTYEEALEMELGFGCKLLVNDNISFYFNKDPAYNDEKPIFNKYILEEVREVSTGKFTKIDKFKLIGCDNLRDFKDIKIIGKPLTLNRVLIALKGLACNLCLLDVDENYNIFIRLDYPFSDIGSFYWDLTKETLEEQSEETQKGINKLLTQIK